MAGFLYSFYTDMSIVCARAASSAQPVKALEAAGPPSPGHGHDFALFPDLGAKAGQLLCVNEPLGRWQTRPAG